MVRKAFIAVLLVGIILTGCGNELEQAQKETQPVKQEQAKPAKPRVNKNCEMKGEEFIQKSREDRWTVIVNCLKDHPRGKELYEVDKILNIANQYFTTSESWEASVTKFLDDYLAGKIK